MIVINDKYYPTRESLEKPINELKEFFDRKDLKQMAEEYSEFMMECFDADIKLQEMVNQRLSEDFISFVIFPIKEYNDPGAIVFELVSNENKKNKIREEVIYKELCELCFGEIEDFYSRIKDIS